MAITKTMEYKAIVTRDCVKKYTRVAWLSALLIAGPSVIMEAVGVRRELVLVIDVIGSIFWAVCFMLIAYFYVKTYLVVKKWNPARVCSVNVLFKRRLEKNVANGLR